MYFNNVQNKIFISAELRFHVFNESLKFNSCTEIHCLIELPTLSLLPSVYYFRYSCHYIQLDEFKYNGMIF